MFLINTTVCQCVEKNTLAVKINLELNLFHLDFQKKLHEWRHDLWAYILKPLGSSNVLH